MALEKYLKELILQTGPISMAEFMQLALSHPEYGYYKTREPFGLKGDFTTSPEISQMFGELIGIWCVDIWYKMGCPKDIQLIEIGPGRGTLMADLLRITRHIPDFHDSISVSMVETSQRLCEIQRDKIGNLHPRINWVANISDLAMKPLILVCNELFDALPIHQYVKQNAKWHEKMLGVNKSGELEFTLSPCAFSPSPNDETKDGSVVEICPLAKVIIEEIASRVKEYSGAALIIDYGYVKCEYKNTLSALSKHTHSDILKSIGMADISAHVDFMALGKVIVGKNVEVYGAISQGEFLRNLGIEVRADKLKENASEKQKADINSALQRLVGNGEKQMGELFKVLSLASDGIVPEGF